MNYIVVFLHSWSYLMWSLWDREKLKTWLDTYIANTCKRVNWDWQIQSNLITITLSKITLNGANCNLNFTSPPPFSHFCLIHIQIQSLKFVYKFFSNIICKIWPIQTGFGPLSKPSMESQLTLWGQPHERKGKEIQKYQSFPLYSLQKFQVLVNLCITLL